MKYSRNQREITENAGKQINVIGITGGIGSGKTAVTDRLRALGYTVIDADEVSRELTADGAALYGDILAKFPQCKNNGVLDRAALRILIAADKGAKRTLEELTHPAIVAEIKRMLDSAKKPAILSAPLLFESALCALCDATVCLYCPVDTRIDRIVKRDGVTPEQALALIRAQLPDSERATLSDYIIPTNRPIEDVFSETEELIRCICNG